MLMLNDQNRKPFSDPSIKSLTFLQDMASMFKLKDIYSPSTKVPKLGLSFDTSDALHTISNGSLISCTS